MELKEYMHAYYLANRETILLKKKERYQKNKELEAARYRAWYEFNLDRKKEYDKKRLAKKKLLQQEKFIVRFDE